MSPGYRQNTKVNDALECHWVSIRARLRAQLGDGLYDSWFSRLDLLSVNDGEVTLIAPTHFIKTWIELYHLHRLETELRAEFGAIRRISLLHRSPAA